MNQDIFRIGWSGRSHAYSPEEIDIVTRVMKTADPLTQGSELKAFEEAFRMYNGSPYAFAVANCTNALDLAAIASGIGKGDEVIVPAHTFCASAIPFARTGARLVWADIDPDTRVISAGSIERLITERTKLIVVVHLYGLMADMDPIRELAQKHGILIVEDGAQALGAEYKGKKAGSIGDFGAFSFHCQKNMSTLGEGGMLTVRDEKTAACIPGLRHNGTRPYVGNREHYWMPAMSNVDGDLPGVWPYNFCMNEVQCALGRSLLKRIDALNNDRQKRAALFIERMRAYPELSFQKTPEGQTHVYHLLAARYNGDATGKTNHDFIKIMAYEYGIKVIVQYYPLYRYPLFGKMGFGEAQCPNTDAFFNSMVSFPFHQWMSDDDFQYMIECTVTTLKRLRGVHVTV